MILSKKNGLFQLKSCVVACLSIFQILTKYRLKKESSFLLCCLFLLNPRALQVFFYCQITEVELIGNR